MTRVGPLTGPGTSTERLGFLSTDLGICFKGRNPGQYVYLFGDTFTGLGVGRGEWMSPVVLVGGSFDPDKVIELSAPGGGKARQAWAYDHYPFQQPTVTWLPTDGITVGDKMYLHAMNHRVLGNVAQHAVYSSVDGGMNWKLCAGSAEPGSASGGDPLREVWTIEHGSDGYIYRYSTAFDRRHPIVLYRARVENFPRADAWQPWGFRGGSWAWGNPATPVLAGSFGEMAARRIEGKVVLSCFNAGRYRGEVRVLDSFTSDITAARVRVIPQGVSWPQDGQGDNLAQLYGVYVHPASTLDKMVILASQWDTGSREGWPYRVVQFTLDDFGYPPPPVAPPRTPNLAQALRDAWNALMRRHG
jgi:hypothetical protein